MNTTERKLPAFPHFSTALLCASICFLLLAYLNAVVIDDTLVLFRPGSFEPMMGLLACFLFIFLVNNAEHLRLRDGRPLLFRILGIAGSLVLSIISLSGKYYMADSYISLEFLFGNCLQALRTVVFLAGGTLAYWFVICLTDRFVDYVADGRDIPVKNDFLQGIFEGDHIFARSLALMTLAWLPHILVAYPAQGSQDSWLDLAQYWGQETWTTMHPIIYTLLLGKMTDFGTSLGRTEIGFFIIAVMQTCVTLLIFAYTLKLMDHLGIKPRFILLALLFYTFLPTFVALAPCLKIDVFFCAFFLLVFDELTVYLFCREEFFSFKRHWFLLAAGICGMFFRYNGYYILLVLILIVFLRELLLAVKHKSSVKKGIIIMLLLLIPTFGMQKGTKALNEAYHLVNISGRVKLALPIQEISRCVVDHTEELTKEEVKKLSKFFSLPPEEFKDNYLPYNFDGIKEYFIIPEGNTGEFIRLWLHFVKKYPGSCLNATLTQHYFLFDLESENTHYYSGVNKRNNREAGNIFYQDSETRQILRKNLLRYYESFDGLPIVGLFTSQAIYTVILFALFLKCLTGKDKRAFLVLFALVMVLGITFLGPATRNHPRYTYPLIYCFPMSLTVSVVSKQFAKTMRPGQD